MYFQLVSGILLRRNPNLNFVTVRNVHFYSQNCWKVHGKFKWYKRKMTAWLQEQSTQIMKSCAKQFEFIAAQRVRRGLQIFHLYTRIWDEVALKEFIRICRFRITKNTKNFLMGAIGVTMYNWDQERILDKEIYSYIHELNEIKRLRDSTVICPVCHLRTVIDINQAEVKYCQCYKVSHKSSIQKKNDWEPFTECKDMIVWRKEEKEYSGLYSYKVYGSFDDVSAEDFLQVQIDLDYRSKWDDTVKELKVIDRDPTFEECIENCSDVIYWETIWPRMFANRDYVFQRKWLYNKDSNIVILVNKGTKHPNAPSRSDTYRVTTYWSFMVIKPFTNFNEPGVEFGLTYFDDPGLSVPAVTAWIIISGLTNYLCRMRQAVKDYKNYRTLHVSKKAIFNPTVINSPNEVPNNSDTKNENKIDENFEEIITDNIHKVTSDLSHRQIESEVIAKKLEPENECGSMIKSDNESEIENLEVETSESDVVNEDRRLLNYFILAKLFA